MFLVDTWQRNRGKNAIRKTKSSCHLHRQQNNVPWLPQKSQCYMYRTDVNSFQYLGNSTQAQNNCSKRQVVIEQAALIVLYFELNKFHNENYHVTVQPKNLSMSAKGSAVDWWQSVPEIGPTQNSLKRAANIPAIFIAGGKSDTRTGHGKMQRSFLAITSPVCSETQTKTWQAGKHQIWIHQ